ncbi:unnamed protein product [Lampetra planeri]
MSRSRHRRRKGPSRSRRAPGAFGLLFHADRMCWKKRNDDDDDDDDGDDDDDDDDDCLLGVKILLIFVTVSWAESLASRAQFDFCDLNMRFEIFLSRMTHINTLQTNCANYSNFLAKLKGKPFLCLAGGQLNDTAMEACLAEIVDGLNHFRDFFFGNNCSESCDTLKSIRDIFLNSNIFHPTKAQSPEAARPPPAAPPRSLEGGLLDCGVFHLRLYVANVHRHAMSRGHAGACRRRDGVAVVAESATRTPGGVVTETPRRRRKKQRGRGGRKQRRGKKERRRGKATATGDDAAGVERGCGSTEMTSVLRREGPPPSLETRQQQQQLQSVASQSSSQSAWDAEATCGPGPAAQHYVRLAFKAKPRMSVIVHVYARPRASYNLKR